MRNPSSMPRFRFAALLAAGCLLPTWGGCASPEASLLPEEHPQQSAQSQPASPFAQPCFRTGCSGAVCAEEQLFSTCEWRPEYDCYKQARCERQADGKCGFTPSEELTTCLAAARKPKAGLGEMCGGIAGIPCAEGLACKGMANHPDASGTCQTP